MDELFLNFPEKRKAKRKLDLLEYARIEKAIELASQNSLNKLTLHPNYVKKADHLFLLKGHTKSTPRLYFTDILDGYLVFLHGRRKKEFAEDPGDTQLALKRIDDIETGRSLSHFR